MSARLPDYEKCTRASAILKSIAHPVISQHLTRMRLEGIVEPRREGNHVYYQLVNPQVLPLVKTMEKIFNL